MTEATEPAQTLPVMSYSRMNSILTCGEQFRLQRKLKLPQREHWASIGGSALHKCIEDHLKSEFSANMQSGTKGKK